MRKSNLLFSAVMALAVGLLTGCSDDLAPDTPGQETVDHDQVRYLNVAIVSPKTVGTRTTDTDFDTGTDVENTIHSMTFAFYDANGLPTGQEPSRVEPETSAKSGNPPFLSPSLKERTFLRMSCVSSIRWT